MKKNPLLEPYRPQEKVSLSPADRGFLMNFNTSFGLISPVFNEPVVGKSKVRLNMSAFVRTAKVNTAAFPRVKYFVDFYAVPMTQLYSLWYQVAKTRVNDVHSSALTRYDEVHPNTIPASIPLCDPSAVESWLQGLCGYFNVTSHEAYDVLEDLGTLAPVDMLGFPQALGVMRLFDLMNYPLPKFGITYRQPVLDPDDGETVLGYADHIYLHDFAYPFAFNPLRACAFQKVYYDHYRNTQYEANDPFSYNLDVNITTESSTIISSQYFSRFFKPHYVNYYKDFFTNIYPSLNVIAYGAEDGSMPTGFAVPDSVLGFLAYSTSYNVPTTSTLVTSPTSGGSAVIGTMRGYEGNTNGASHYDNKFTSVQQIRAAFALDKLSRIAALNPQHVNPQLRARFGFQSDSIAKQESTRIGSYEFDIQFGEVVATATTGDGDNSSTLGEIGGKGIGGRTFGDDIEFTATDDCLIVGVGYALPRMSLDSGGIDEWNTKSLPMDFFTPEFQDMGMQPLYLRSLFEINEDTVSAATARGNCIVGYQPRYSEYKIGIDRNHGLFRFGKPLSPFVTHQFLRIKSTYWGPSADTLHNGVSADFFKLSPSDGDSLFAESYTGDEMTDQLFGQFTFKFDVLQPMSVHGEPRSII